MRDKKMTENTKSHRICAMNSTTQSLMLKISLKRLANIQHRMFVTAIATALLNLGHAQSDTGDVEDAMRNLTKAMKIYVALHGTNHRIVAANLNYLGYAYQQMGMVEKGKEELERAVEIMKQYSPLHPGNNHDWYNESSASHRTYITHKLQI